MPKQLQNYYLQLTEKAFGKVLETPCGRILTAKEISEMFSELITTATERQKEIDAHNSVIGEYLKEIGAEL